MLKKRFVGLLAALSLLWAAAPASAALPDYQGLFTYLDTAFPDQQKIISKISAVHQHRLLFPKNEASLEKGRELLILRQPPNTPDALLPQIGVLQIERLTGNSYVARQVAVFEDLPPESGDPVATPAAPLICLYSNISEKNGFAPYQKLLQKLLDHHYPVLEIDALSHIPSGQEYGLLLRLEGTGNTLVTKLQSLYSGKTFYSEAQACDQAFQTKDSAGEEFMPATKPPARVPDTPHRQEKPEKAAPPATDAKLRPSPAEPGSPNFQTVSTEAGNDFQPLRLPDKFQRLVICQLDETPALEFVLLNNDRVQVFHKIDNSLQSVYDYAFDTDGIIGLHLHAMDLNRDGRDELAVTLGQRKIAVDAWSTRLCAQILSIQDHRLQPIKKDIPFYLRVISEPDGKPVLLGQAKGEYEPYTGAILKIDPADDGRLSTSTYAPAKGVYSLYQFSRLPGYPENIMILEPGHHISVYHAETEKIMAMTDQEFGAYEILSYPVALEEPEFLGGFDKKTSADCFAPRRFSLKPAYDEQVFTINKQREMDWGLEKLKRLIGKENARDSLVAVQWTGEAVRQTYTSKAIAKDILDFSFMRGEDKDEIFILVKDAQGFALLRME
ncbi:MAG: VCBS repeat-containing protein [Desulfobacterales bacterium]|nr:VCBS repeat-containing protein [Desulfobacterales bacterium]